jgi:teichuronic acid biosynthesis protein TuaE
MKKLLYLILPSTAILGSTLPGVGKIFGFRILVLLLFFGTLSASRMSFKGIKTISRFRFLTATWIIVGVAGLVSIVDLSAGIDAIAAIIVGLILAHAIILTNDPFGDLVSIQRGWVAAFLLSSVFGVRELLTGQHQVTYWAGETLSGVDLSLAASVFGNPNAYAVFLVTMVPILAKSLTDSRSRFGVTFYGSLNILGFVLMLATGSRLCFFAMLLQLAVLLRWGSPLFRRRLMSSLLVTALAGVFLSGALYVIVHNLPAKLATATPSRMWAEATLSSGNSSGNERLSTYKDGLWMVMESHGLGVGAGNFEAVMLSGHAPYDTNGTVNPHNAYLEIMSEYGVAVFVLVMIWVASCFGVARRALRSDQTSETGWGVTVVAILVGTSLSALADGSYLGPSYNFLAISTVLLACAGLERRARAAERPDGSSMPQFVYTRDRAPGW